MTCAHCQANTAYHCLTRRGEIQDQPGLGSLYLCASCARFSVLAVDEAGTGTTLAVALQSDWQGINRNVQAHIISVVLPLVVARKLAVKRK